ncbi:MAG: anti-sigma F factor antagonist [Clostridium sp.]|nr:anti-sigma F factor antagonist [Clostridium sp.]
MDIKFSNLDGFLIVELIGELDHHSAEEVRGKIDDRIDRDNIKKVILNFRNVTFMDSSGIGVVIGRYRKLKNKGGHICVAEMNKRIDKVFTLSGLYKIIKPYKNIDEAMESI